MGVISSIFKAIIALVLLIALPLIVLVLYAIWPIAAVMLVIFLPFVIIGAIVGYSSGKKRAKELEEK